MQKILSDILYLFIIGSVIVAFVYIAAFLLPILLLAALCFWGWMKYKQKKMFDIWQFYHKKTSERDVKEDIIDVEYEVLDDNKR